MSGPLLNLNRQKNTKTKKNIAQTYWTYLQFSYHNSDLLYHTRLLTIRRLEQGSVAAQLKSSLQKFYGRHYELVDCYGVSVSIMKTDLLNVS